MGDDRRCDIDAASLGAAGVQAWKDLQDDGSVRLVGAGHDANVAALREGAAREGSPGVGESADLYTLTLQDGASIAFRRGRPDGASRKPGLPGVVFCGGFRSDMTGIKARTLAEHCRRRGQEFLCFDYSGHGASSGRFEDGTIGQWLIETLAILDQETEGPQILVGSSMGAWIAVLAARDRPEKIAGLVTIAAAPDMTDLLIDRILSDEQRAELARSGRLLRPSDYDPAGDPITARLIEEGRAHLVLGGPIAVTAPVRLVHGMADRDVPWDLSLQLAERIVGEDTRPHPGERMPNTDCPGPPIWP